MNGPDSPGAVLREARERRGLKTKELASITRISPRFIECLEEDRYDELPGEVFVRGFLRNCARELQLDPEDMIASYERHAGYESSQQSALVEPEISTNARLASLFEGSQLPRFTYVVAILAIILGLGLSVLIFGQSDTEQLSDIDTPSTTWEQTP